MIIYFLLNDECAIIDSSCRMKTPYAPLLYSKLSVHIAKDLFILFTLSVATAIVSVDTIKLGVYVANHYFCLFTLSVATSTVSVDTIDMLSTLPTIIFILFTLSVATTSTTVSVDTI